MSGGLTERIDVRLDVKTYRALLREAKQSERSLGQIVRLALREHLAAKRTGVST